MLRRAPFIHKLLKRLERLDRASVQTYLSDLAQENSLQAEIFDHLSEGILIASRKGHLVYANRQASFLLGLDQRKLEKTPLAEVIQDSELSYFIASHLKDLKERLVGDLHLLVPREMNVRVVLLPLESKTEDHDILVLINTIQAEDRNRGDEKLSRMEALATLAGGIAHEIGNPLNSLNIHLELMKKELKSLAESKRKSLEKTLQVLNSETSRLDRIVRNFLKATRKPPLRFRADNLNQILEEAVRFMQPELADHKIKANLKTDKSLPPFLLDRERLHQAFINLIKNAMEAMPKGGNFWIQVVKREKIVVLNFKDEGSGISQDDLPHIFEAYYTTKNEGSGLGLMTVYNVVREHGGRIEVTSKTGKGSVFTIYLPIRQPKLQLGFKK